jgi:hypothetical protein
MKKSPEWENKRILLETIRIHCQLLVQQTLIVNHMAIGLKPPT